MGFAAMSKNLAINMPVNAPEATLQINTDDPNRLLKSSGGNFSTALPTGRVTFSQTVSAAGVKIVGGSAQFNQDLVIGNIEIRSGTQLVMAGGKTATVTGTLSGEGSWTGGNGVTIGASASVAPGASIGELTGNTLTFEAGAAYDWQFDGNAAPGVDYDTISATTVDIVGALTFNVDDSLFGGSLDGSEEFTVIAASSDIFGNFDGSGVLLGVSFNDDWSGTLTRVDNGSGGWDLILSALSGSVPGDADGDGDVDADDYLIVKANLGLATGAGASDGDFDEDGTVEWDDLMTLQGAMSPAGGGVIPEPATMGLLAIGALALMRRKRR
jgi:hypothetical protein